MAGEAHYIEIVTPTVEQTCAMHERAHGVSFAPPDGGLGGARVARLPGGARLGVRAPMHDAEQPVTRCYLRVDDIEQAASVAAEAGATVALPPTALPGDHGRIAIVILGGVEHGLWAVP